MTLSVFWIRKSVNYGQCLTPDYRPHRYWYFFICLVLGFKLILSWFQYLGVFIRHLDLNWALYFHCPSSLRSVVNFSMDTLSHDRLRLFHVFHPLRSSLFLHSLQWLGMAVSSLVLVANLLHPQIFPLLSRPSPGIFDLNDLPGSEWHSRSQWKIKVSFVSCLCVFHCFVMPSYLLRRIS